MKKNVSAYRKKYNIIPLCNGRLHHNVTICKHKSDSNQRFCVKTKSLSNKTLLQKEIDILSSIEHPNIIKIKKWSIHPFLFYIVPYYQKEIYLILLSK